MAIVPGGDRTKSIATGSPYSPNVSFNPDKSQYFDMAATNLGLLAGGSSITTDGVNVTIPIGMKFIQNGIVVEIVNNPVLVAIPGGAFPKFVVADNVNETPGTNVTIVIQSVAPVAPIVTLGTLTPNDTTFVPSKEVSIRALNQRINTNETAITAAALDVEKDGGGVKTDIGTMNFTGENVSVTDPGGDQVDVAVDLDIEEEGANVVSETKKINFKGKAVTATTPGAGDADVTIDSVTVKDEGVNINTETQRINFTGLGVTAALDGGDPDQVNVNIPVVGGSAVNVQENGAPVVAGATDINFKDGLVATTPGGTVADVDLALDVQFNAILQGSRPAINFLGAGVSAVLDDGPNNRVNITIAGGVGAPIAAALFKFTHLGGSAATGPLGFTPVAMSYVGEEMVVGSTTGSFGFGCSSARTTAAGPFGTGSITHIHLADSGNPFFPLGLFERCLPSDDAVLVSTHSLPAGDSISDQLEVTAFGAGGLTLTWIATGPTVLTVRTTHTGYLLVWGE